MWWGHLKIFFSRIAGPEKLKFTRKLSDMAFLTYYKIKFVKTMVPGGRVGPQ
jgi:hypothetical protein